MKLAIVIWLAPVLAMGLVHLWLGIIRPRLIPAREIEALADEVIARYGGFAAELAAIEEDRAWRYSDIAAQGRWRRVRQAIARRG